VKKNIKFILISFFFFLLLISITEIFLRYQGFGTPIIYEKSYQYGYAPAPNQKLIRFNNKNVTIDSNGFRIGSSINNTYNKIYFLGDSVTYGGSYIDDDELYSENFCQKINQILKKKFNCYNGGVNAYGFENIIERYKSIKKNKDTFIIITLIPGDFSRNFMQIESLPYFTKKHTHFLKATTELSAYYIDVVRTNLRFDQKKFSVEQKLDDYIKRKITKNLHQLRQLQKNDPNLIIVFFPPKQFLLEKNFSEFDNFFFKNIINKSKYYNLSDHLKSYNNINNIYYDNVHLNSNGHQVVSEILFKLLKNDFLNTDQITK
jgi:lysophospholipase L1-like esterase